MNRLVAQCQPNYQEESLNYKKHIEETTYRKRWGEVTTKEKVITKVVEEEAEVTGVNPDVVLG